MTKTTEVKKAGSKKMTTSAKTSEMLPVTAGTTDTSEAIIEDTGLQDLFSDAIKDIYWAENHLVKTLPKMQNAAASDALQNAIANHLEQTKEHVKRIELVFELMGKRKQAKKCDAMEGISKEGEGIIEDTDTGTTARDTGIIMASQKVEHYEIATYSGIIQLATKLGYTDIAALLEQTLAEEKESSQLLTQLAASMP